LLKTWLSYFNRYMQECYNQDIKLQDLTVEDGSEYMRRLMERNKRYTDHPMHVIYASTTDEFWLLLLNLFILDVESVS
jgi:hypothetical protein